MQLQLLDVWRLLQEITWLVVAGLKYRLNDVGTIGYMEQGPLGEVICPNAK